MAAVVVCARCGESKEAVGGVPIPGELGRTVGERVCGDCWGEWIQASIRVINHYNLHPAVKEHRDQLFALMREFLKLKEN